MGQVSLSGTLTIGPASSADGTFPSSTSSVSLSTTPNPKPSLVSTGVLSRNLNSPGAFVALSGVGATDTVTKGDFLYLKTNGLLLVRMTFADPGGGGDWVSVVPIYGLQNIELQPLGYLKLLEAKGVGQLEYMISGQT